MSRSAYESVMAEMNDMQRRITQLTAENKMLRNNVAMRINGTDLLYANAIFREALEKIVAWRDNRPKFKAKPEDYWYAYEVANGAIKRAGGGE